MLSGFGGRGWAGFEWRPSPRLELRLDDALDCGQAGRRPPPYFGATKALKQGLISGRIASYGISHCENERLYCIPSNE